MSDHKTLTAAINKLTLSDESLTGARFSWRILPRLPDDPEEILHLLPTEHRDLIQENLEGKIKIFRGVRDFDLTQILHYYEEKGEKTVELLDYVKKFFHGRPVETAQGKGLIKRDFPIYFDWVVVLDPMNKAFYSFILNLTNRKEKVFSHA